MAFSGALTLTDLNDFISPSQACIKPVEQIMDEYVDGGSAATKIQVDSSGNYYEVAAQKSERPTAGRKLQTAQISLNDCLACSGCITSAESVLITMQSHQEVLSFLSSNPTPSLPGYRLPVISIAPQSLASLAASTSYTSYGSAPLETILHRVRAFCQRELGFAHVFDTAFARHLALLEHAREFNDRKAAGASGANTLPMLASACPGWVCYAEKAHAEMLPFISRTKSPQQIMGTLVKQWMAEKWCRTPDQIYHVTVMPCYDKKLEASRQDFYNETYKTREVDCVITTGELQQLMLEKGWDLSIRVAEEEQLNPSTDVIIPQLVSHPGTSSGSYLHSLISFISAAPDNQGRNLRVNTRTIRSADYEEHIVEDVATGEIVFKGAKCYGFRNLQNVVRKVGKENGVRGLSGGAVRGRARRKVEATGMKDRGYDYIEVMACPSGCVNGGGQIRPSKKALETASQNVEIGTDDTAQIDMTGLGTGMVLDAATKWGDKDWIRKVETAYWNSRLDRGTLDNSPEEQPLHLDPDVLAARVLVDLCHPVSGPLVTDGQLEMDTAGLPGRKQKHMTMHNHAWMSHMDERGEARRQDTFRTSYRKVESEVVGLAVKW